MQFKPNLRLLKDYNEVENHNSRRPPYIAIYRRGNKTLVYMGDRHAKKESWNMVDWCFSNQFQFKPDVLLTEFENRGRNITKDSRGKRNTLSHAAFVAARHNVPVVLADLSESEMMSIIGTNDKKYLDEVLRAGPFADGNELQQKCAKLNRFGRNRFMIQNIAAALNKYDTVFCIFGEGHFREQAAVLSSMLGDPEYIMTFPDMNTEFGKVKTGLFERARDNFLNMIHKMEIVRLVEFKKEGEQHD